MITLIIVDCQNDFITGTMSVKGAKDALKNIKEFISRHQFEIEKILFTVDWHPYNHTSFKKYGGQWPHHCVQFTPGACIEPKLLKLVQSLDIDYSVSRKGEIEEVEEYGAFSDIEYVSDHLGERYYLDIIEVNANSEFIVCGIAGDYCVKETISNLIEGGIVPKIYAKGVVSIDGGKTFSEFIKENKLEKIV
jgi:nicotinamidase/pyrazinamidase